MTLKELNAMGLPEDCELVVTGTAYADYTKVNCAANVQTNTRDGENFYHPLTQIPNHDNVSSTKVIYLYS